MARIGKRGISGGGLVPLTRDNLEEMHWPIGQRILVKCDPENSRIVVRKFDV